MKLTIFAATGGIGRQVLEQAIATGHDVTAVVRNPEKLSREVRVVRADLAAPDQAALESAVKGADAVISALGPVSAIRCRSGLAGHAVHRPGDAGNGCSTHHRRQRGADLNRPLPRPPEAAQDTTLAMGSSCGTCLSPLIKAVLRKHYADLARMEDVLRESGLDWTIVRPPRLTDQALTGTYRTANGQNLRRGVRISRADVAHFMLRVLEQPQTIRQAIGIAY